VLVPIRGSSESLVAMSEFDSPLVGLGSDTSFVQRII